MLNDKLNAIMVAMDMTAADEALVQYTRLMADGFDAKKLYFIHVERDLNLSDDLKKQHGKLLEQVPVDERLEASMEKTVNKFFADNEGLDMEIEVVEGKPFDALLHRAEIKKVDLLIAGNKPVDGGSGITIKKVARNAKSSILFVPTLAHKDIKRILVPVDFSKQSLSALQAALHLQSHLGGTEVCCLHVYDIPDVNYFKISRNFEQFAQIIENNAREAMDNFFVKHDLQDKGIKTAFVENSAFSPAKHINEYAERIGYDLIAMGAAGHSAIESFLFGSVAESLPVYAKSIPVLVIR